MKVRVNTWLRISDKIGIAGIILMLASALIAPSKHPAALFGLAAAWVLAAASFILNGYLGLKHGKMHMIPGRLISRKSRGDRWFNFDITVFFGAAIFFLVLAYWYIKKALV